MSVPADIEELIVDARLSAHLATTVDDRPHVAPVWYVYEDGTLSVLTGGRKLRNVRQNPRVAVSIERADERGVHWGVQLLGTARIVNSESRVREVQRRMGEKYSRRAADGGKDEEEGDWALVEISVGSATSQHY